MSIADLQKQQFQDRLKRISAGGANTMTQVYAGISEEALSGKPGKSKKSGGGTGTGNLSARNLRNMPMALFSGLFVGAIAVLAVRYGRFKLMGTAVGGENADILMMTDVVLAVTLAIFLRIVVRVKSRIHGAGKLIGVGAMVVFMNNIVVAAPGLFEQTFSPDWVDQVIANTTPISALITQPTQDRAPARKVPDGFIAPPTR